MAAPVGSSSCPTPCTPRRWPPRRSAARSARSPTACCSRTTERRAEPVLILTSGAHRVDTEQGRGLDRRRSRSSGPSRSSSASTPARSSAASPRSPTRRRSARTSTRALQAYDEIWAAAGHPAAVFSTTYDELRAMTGAQRDRRQLTAPRHRVIVMASDAVEIEAGGQTVRVSSPNPGHLRAHGFGQGHQAEGRRVLRRRRGLA